MRKAAVLVLLSLSLYGAEKIGWLAPIRGTLEKAVSFRITFPVNKENQKLKEENLELLSKIVDQKNLLTENEALRIQLGAKREFFPQEIFFPAKVLGGNTFFLLIDKGKSDGVALGQTVVYKNIFVGKVVSVSEKRARLELPFAPESRIPVKTEKGALGILTGQAGSSGGMMLKEVTLNETLEAKDMVFSQGGEGGVLPDFLIGQITKVTRQESALFQQAEVKSPLDFRTLETVFLVL